MGSLKKDQNVLAKSIEGLKRAIDDAVLKVKVRHQRSVPFGKLYKDSFVSSTGFDQCNDYISIHTYDTVSNA